MNMSKIMVMLASGVKAIAHKVAKILCKKGGKTQNLEVYKLTVAIEELDRLRAILYQRLEFLVYGSKEGDTVDTAKVGDEE